MLTRILRILEEIFYRLVIVPLLAFLPDTFAYGMACLRGNLRYQFDTVIRKRIVNNLDGVLGEKLSRAQKSIIAHDYLRRQSCQAIDEMRMTGTGRALARLVEIRGLEHLKMVLAAGKGAIICCAHFGSYNSGLSLIGASSFPITAVGDWIYKADPGMPLILRLFWRIASTERRLVRHRHRSNIEPRKGQVETAVRIANILNAHEVVAIPIEVPVADEDRKRATEVDFLGRKISLLPGSVSMAQYTNSSVLVMVMRRSKDWRHQTLEILPVSLDGDTETIFKRCVAMIEEPIRQDPAGWDYWASLNELKELGLLTPE